MRFICLFLIPLFAIPTSCQGQSWDRFRGPNGCGVVEANLPTTWSDTENLAWSSDLPGRGSSSPVVWDGNIYLTSYSGYGASLEAPGDRSALRLHVLCVDLQDGSVNWTCTLGPDAAEQAMTKRVGEHGYASPTPCVDEDAVYVSFGPSGVAAVSHDGDLIWRRSVGTGTAGFGAAASPMLVGDLLIQNASIESGTLFALEKATGEVRWRTEGITRAWTTPTLIEGEDGTAELVVNQRDAILGIDPSTGKQRWSCDAIEDYIVPCVLHQDGLLYCSGGRSNKTFAVRPGGDGDVSESNVVWDVSLGANVTTPVLVNGNLFWSHDKAIALCLRA
ncbi:MAG: PQQ-binding-like beta-propeller repeat protein, partial [Planctomycetota bacterium]